MSNWLKTNITKWGRPVAHQSCLICMQSSCELICECCQQDLTLFDLSQCQYNLLNWTSVQRALPDLRCECLLALCEYQWPIANLLVQLKFAQRLSHAKALADLFCRYVLEPEVALPQVLIPVPLHRSRFQQRKYNQAQEIARHIARVTGVNIDSTLCKRVRATAPQTDLSGAQRRKNLHQAFMLNPLPAYQHVAIFDDIITTGTTVNELKRTLRKANPDMQIDIWSICLSLPE